MRQITEEQYQIIQWAYEAGVEAAGQLQSIHQHIIDNETPCKEYIRPLSNDWPLQEAMGRFKTVLDNLPVVETPGS